MRCGACVGTCPSNAISLMDDLLFDEGSCLLCKGIECARCIMVCPVGALEWDGGSDE